MVADWGATQDSVCQIVNQRELHTLVKAVLPPSLIPSGVLTPSSPHLPSIHDLLDSLSQSWARGHHRSQHVTWGVGWGCGSEDVGERVEGVEVTMWEWGRLIRLSKILQHCKLFSLQLRRHVRQIHVTMETGTMYVLELGGILVVR